MCFFDPRTGEFNDSVQTRVRSRLMVNVGNPYKDRRADSLIPEKFLSQSPSMKRGVGLGEGNGPRTPPGSPPHESFAAMEGEGEAVFAKSPSRKSPSRSDVDDDRMILPESKRHKVDPDAKSEGNVVTEKGKKENSPTPSTKLPAPRPSKVAAPRGPPPPPPPKGPPKKKTPPTRFPDISRPPPPKLPPVNQASADNPTLKPPPPQTHLSTSNAPPKPPPPHAHGNVPAKPPVPPRQGVPWQAAPPKPQNPKQAQLQLPQQPRIMSLGQPPPPPSMDLESPDKKPIVNLPPGWMCVWSKSQKRWYFFDTKSNKSVWQWPPPGGIPA
jgi:hypothetical protein